MTRTIPLKIQNEYITGDKCMIGAAGSHNDVILRMEFSGMWDGLTKMVQFRDALGKATIEVLLTADMLEADDTSVYLVPVPNGAKKYAGASRALRWPGKKRHGPPRRCTGGSPWARASGTPVRIRSRTCRPRRRSSCRARSKTCLPPSWTRERRRRRRRHRRRARQKVRRPPRRQPEA